MSPSTSNLCLPYCPNFSWNSHPVIFTQVLLFFSKVTSCKPTCALKHFNSINDTPLFSSISYCSALYSLWLLDCKVFVGKGLLSHLFIFYSMVYIYISQKWTEVVISESGLDLNKSSDSRPKQAWCLILSVKCREVFFCEIFAENQVIS